MNRRFKILIVDDAPKNIQVVANLLGEEEHDISYATNGSQALANMEETDFDLVLLDVMMPGMSGYEVCREIKKIRRSSDIPVIFITARTDEESIIEGFDAGGQDYITKPFNSAELKA